MGSRGIAPKSWPLWGRSFASPTDKSIPARFEREKIKKQIKQKGINHSNKTKGVETSRVRHPEGLDSMRLDEKNNLSSCNNPEKPIFGLWRKYWANFVLRVEFDPEV